MVSLDDDPPDSADTYTEAAAALLRYLGPDARFTEQTIAEGLQHLCEARHLVAPGWHERLCESYARALHEAETAAEELLRRVHETGEAT